MSVEVLGRVTPLWMVGESHCLAFDQLLFHPDGSQEHFVCRSIFLPRLPASQFAAQGTLSTHLSDALVQAGLLTPDLRASYLSVNASAAYIAGVPVIAPPMVFFGGDIDLVSRIYPLLGSRYDFALPDDSVYGVDYEKQPVAYAQIQEQIAGIVQPFVDALSILQQHRIARIMVHGLPPRNANQAMVAFQAIGEVPDVRVRSKLATLVNRQLRSACEKLEIGFIDCWPETAKDGVLRPEFALDGIHVNRQSAVLSLGKVAAHMYDCTLQNANPARYQSALDLAQKNGEGQHLLPLWSAHGLLALQADVIESRKLLASMHFVPSSGNQHAHTDWVGASRRGREGLLFAKPSQASLQSAYGLLGSEAAKQLLHAGSECALTIVSFRPLKKLLHAGQQPWPTPGTSIPSGLRCAILHLAGGMRYCFDHLDASHTSVVDAHEGMLMVFDPRRLRCRAEGVLDDTVMVELVLIPRLQGQPFRLMWAGQCDFPADPFQYSLRGTVAYPSTVSDEFSARALPGSFSNQSSQSPRM